MTHRYNITGMTCSGCQSTVEQLLSKVSGVKNVLIDLYKGEATIDMDKHVSTTELKSALSAYPKYQLSEKNHMQPGLTLPEEDTKSWIETYKPILLIFAYITGSSFLVEAINGEFLWMRWMNHFMAGFFLVFSFFKMLNLKGFADSYATYDIVAKKWYEWGYVYVFIELSLAIAYLTAFNPFVTNAITFIVMTISIIGVLQSVLSKKKIKCACLGDVFNVPMSTVTIIEDALMIVMSGAMLSSIL